MTLSPKDYDKCVEILRIIYLRIMQLRFSYQWLQAIAFNGLLEKECPDMCYCMKWTFVSDAYITLNGLFTNGTYSFLQLRTYSDDIQKLIDKAQSDINQEIPGFREVRNRMFAHFVDKRDASAANLLFFKFESIFAIVSGLHNYCRDTLGISDIELGVYKSEIFCQMKEQIHTFLEIVMCGYKTFKHEELLEVLPKTEALI